MSQSDPLLGPIVLPAPLDARIADRAALDRTDASRMVLALFDDYQRPLRRYVASLGLTTADAEDVVQDVFIALFQHLQRGRPADNLPAWLFQVAHNLGLRQRRRGRRLWGLLTVTGTPSNDRVDPAASPEAQVADAEQRRRWQRVLQALPERDRCCVVLRAEGHTYRDIAAALGVSLGAVAKSMARALERFARVDTPGRRRDERNR